MNQIKQRAITNFPPVLLTLVSIIQALALELLWAKVSESSFLWQGDVNAWIGWGMVLVVFLSIIHIWVMYTTMLMGLIWQPSLRDSILPFVIGIQEFLLISLVDEQFSPAWLYVLASIFVAANWITHTSMRRARAHEGNAQFFAGVKPATWKDFLPSIALILGFILLGLAQELVFTGPAIPMFAVVFANALLVFLITRSRNLWWRAMKLPDSTREDGD